MTQKNRLARGGRIDRSASINFMFNGQPMSGYANDTIASALLANGVKIISRSFKYHRPRGIFSAGVEEPNGIVQVGDGDRRTPNVCATITELQEGMNARSQSGWPSVNMDIGAALSAAARILPAGFYYKTFMWPPKLWMFYEKIIRRAASSAQSPAQRDADSYEHRQAHCDVLIIGGGPAGLSAALTAGRSGARVMVVEMNPFLGGDLLDHSDEDNVEINGLPTDEWLRQTVENLTAMENVKLLTRTTAQGYHDYNALVAVENIVNGDARQRLWKIRAAQVVIATGAIERPPVFVNNDLPGIMTANAVRTYINRYGVLAGRNILYFTNNDSAYRSALTAAAAGARIRIADIRENVDGYWQTRAQDFGIEVYLGYGVCNARFISGGINAEITRLSPAGDFIAEASASIASLYDVVAVSGGWTPSVHLFSQARGQLTWNNGCGAFVAAAAHIINPCRVCGSANGVWSLSECLRSGSEAGAQASKDAGFKSSPIAIKTAAAMLECAPMFTPFIPTRHPLGQGPGKHFVDMMNDVTAGDILLAAREGYDSVEHMKRYTAAGFGADQGKTGNINALVLLAHARGITAETAGHTTFRPQYTPVSFGVITGAERRELFAPERVTPIHEWHLANRAVFEDVGEWKRPCYFPQGAETMAQAVARECLAAREKVAMMDASTLGKIDIQGADAAVFLDLIYTNMISTLKIGYCRYGLMLREDGMVYDDGVVMRLGENHFHITTSTGHAGPVMNWLEEWLQTEWPNLRVFCTSVTEQWAVIAVVGPKSRAVLSQLTKLPLSAQEMPFMTIREAVVADVPARVCRVSFSGELAFEINAPARYGQHLWEAVWQAGERHGITAYGTETMRVLRAEKGYIIAGQDSDGATSPIDMGLSWMLSKKKNDYIGRRSLFRAAIQKNDRPQFVGLLSQDGQTVLPEGIYLTAQQDAKPPLATEGYVTSSYMSATLGHPIALAMVKGGAQRMGELLYAAMLDGSRVAVKITDTVFWDKEGKRRDGESS